MAGASFTEVLATSDPVRDVVFRASGAVLVATVAGGTFEAQGTGPFARLGQTAPNSPDAQPPQLACLVERPAGEGPGGELLGCGANWQPDYMAVGRATNPLAWQKLFRFVELAGPLACPAGTTSQLECDPMWPALEQQFGVAGPPPSCGGVVDGSPVDGPPQPPPRSGGCCDASAAAPSWLAVLVGAGLRRRRRRTTAHASGATDHASGASTASRQLG